MENEDKNLADLAKRTFGESVRKFRLANQWTQEGLARALTANGINATQTMVAKIERGDRPTSIGEAAVMAATFGIPVQSLLPLDRESATASHLGSLLTNFHIRLERLEDLRLEVSEYEADIERILGEWDDAVGKCTPEERQYLSKLDIDARSSSENGMRGTFRGEHPEEG